MIGKLGSLIRAAREAIGRHGGGVHGFRIVIGRSFQVARALGLKGLLRRIGGAAGRVAPPLDPLPDFSFPAPAQVQEVNLRIGVMAHVFYPDLTEEFAEYLENIPHPFALMVSVVNVEAKEKAELRFARIGNVSELHVRIVPNRGRDIAPLLVSFREEVLRLDLVCHIHTKKSLYTGSEQEHWRQYLLQSLLGTPERVGWILGMFQAMSELGMMYPESFRSVSLAAHTWLSNVTQARELGARLGIAVDPHEYLDFPAGSMFWARVEAIRPLYELDLSLRSFPKEVGQNDGTLQHAIERMLGQVVRRQGMLLAILPTNGELTPRTEGSRNWHTHFDVPIEDQILGRAIDAGIVSFDVFDTLVTRPFLTPVGSLAYLETRVKQRFGLEGFARLRRRAEDRARARTSGDVALSEIYATLAELPEVKGVDVAAIRDMEVAHEQAHLASRAALLESALRTARAGKRVIAISDMYLDEQTMRSVLPADVNAALERIYVSCDTGWRKDTGEAWKRLPEATGGDPSTWLHVGDNEHSDKQLPHDAGFMPPAHVLRPSSLLDVVPALRKLRPNGVQAARWENQLWLGLLANRFSDMADRSPSAFSDTIRFDDPGTMGYVVFGPPLLDYLAWMTRRALHEGTNKILFLSREGYLLQRAFKILQDNVPAAASLAGSYFLVSRRAAGTAMLRDASDLRHLLGGTFTGTLRQLLTARMGKPIADAIDSILGEQAASTKVFLPEMGEKVVEMLGPATTRILELAAIERKPYLQYWSEQVGEDRVMLADVGYAGTIQTHLARLTGRALSGAYFALKASAVQTGIHGGSAQARFYDERTQAGGSSGVLRFDMLLEAVLTASTPQFSHFEYEDGDLRARFANDDARRASATLTKIQRGVEDFVRDACAVVGADAVELDFDRELVQAPLICLGTGLWRSGAWARDLFVDDHYTGRGNVLMNSAR